MCVGAESQHILRMSFVLEDEAKSFRHGGRRLLVTSHPTRRLITFIPLAPQARRP